jgi:hypothetical protein
MRKHREKLILPVDHARLEVSQAGNRFDVAWKLYRRFGWEADERLVCEHRRGDLFMPCQGVGTRHGQHKRLAKNVKAAKSRRIAERRPRKTHIQFMAHDSVKLRHRRKLVDGHADSRVGFFKGGNPRVEHTRTVQ